MANHHGHYPAKREPGLAAAGVAAVFVRLEQADTGSQRLRWQYVVMAVAHIGPLPTRDKVVLAVALAIS